jgi:hypothetical protein
VGPGRGSRVDPGAAGRAGPGLDLTAVTSPVGVGVARLLGELAWRERWLVVFDNAEDPRALSRASSVPGRTLLGPVSGNWGGSPVRQRAASVTPFGLLASWTQGDRVPLRPTTGDDARQALRIRVR